MRRVLKGRAAEDRAGAADRAMFEESRSLSLCLRYATAVSRDLHRSIADLAKLRESGGGEDEGSGSPPEPPAPGDDGVRRGMGVPPVDPDGPAAVELVGLDGRDARPPVIPAAVGPKVGIESASRGAENLRYETKPPTRLPCRLRSARMQVRNP